MKIGKLLNIRKTAASAMTAVVLLTCMPALAQTTEASDTLPAPPSLDAGEQGASEASPVMNGKYILTFEDTASKQQMKETVSKYNGTKMDGSYESHIISLNLADKQYDKIKQDSAVAAIEPNQPTKIKSHDKHDPITSYSHKKTNVPNAWEHDLTGKGETIAVLDTGVSKQHQDLDVEKGTSTVNYTDSYHDDNGHGTHVAGIIAAQNDDAGTKGVAIDAGIYSVKVLDSDGEGNLINLIEGIDWAIQNQVDVINISLGTYTASPALKTELDKAASKGILLVAAAGNSGTSPVGYPAQYDHVVAVGATDKHNDIASFSSRGSGLDVVAPGKNIVSTYLDNQYAKGSGTSQAAPYVSGMLALLQQQHPDMSAEEITDTLYANTHDLGPTGQDTTYGRGLVQYPDFAGTDGQADSEKKSHPDKKDDDHQTDESETETSDANNTTSHPFPDVIEGKMGGHYDAIQSMAKKDAIHGKPDGHFYPWEDVLRGQMASMIQNLRHYSTPPAEQVLTVYDDIDKHNDYAKPIAAVTHAGVFKGSDGYFGEYDKLKREQMATVLRHTFSLDEVNEKENNGDTDVYLDNVDPSHKESVQILANLGITVELDNFRPHENVTRAQVATFLDKALKNQP